MPKVSIGIPVYNGARFLDEAIESFLNQTFEDFELIISDNASTDATREICEYFVKRDERVRYYRNSKNLGAAKNYNLVFKLSTGEYIKWAAHDDYCAPTYLEKCVRILDTIPAVVICHTKTIYINEHGQEYTNRDDQLDFRSLKPSERYKGYFYRPYKRCNAIFGLIRRQVLEKTSLIGAFYGSDQVLLAELTLRGLIYRIPEPLFYRRDHPAQVGKWGNKRDQEAWFDPRRRDKITFPYWKLLIEHIRTILRVPLEWDERILCIRYLGHWVKGNDGKLIRELFLMEK